MVLGPEEVGRMRIFAANGPQDFQGTYAPEGEIPRDRLVENASQGDACSPFHSSRRR